MSADRVIEPSLWERVKHHGVPYEDPHIGAHLATVQTRPDSELAARSVAAIDRELAWLGLSGRDRVFQPLCGPGNYAERISATVGCSTYLGQDLNPAAIAAARRRCPRQRYSFEVSRFGPDAEPPDHDLCLLTYEAVNTFAPDELSRVVRLVADRMILGGRLFVDLRPRHSPGVEAIERDVRHIPAGAGLFLPEEHALAYSADLHEGGRLYVEKFELMTARDHWQFFSWLWLYEPDELVEHCKWAGLRETARAQLHVSSSSDSPGGGHSIQFLFERGK